MQTLETIRKESLIVKSKKMRFIGYSLVSKGYRLYDELKRKVFVRRDVAFNEYEFGNKDVVQVRGLDAPNQKDEKVKHEPKREEQQDVTIERIEEEQNKLPERRSERVKRPPIRYGYDEYADNAINSSESCHHVAYNVVEIDEPTNIQDALQSSYAEEWKAAADSEYNSLIENKTWKLVQFPPWSKGYWI